MLLTEHDVAAVATANNGWSSEEARAMAEVLRRAARRLGRTAPLPPVGAALVRDGHILGYGVTGDAGCPHPITQTLAAAGARAREASLCLTLAPDPRLGTDPMLLEAIVAAGIRRVVVAIDPLATPGITCTWRERLAAGGVCISVGLGEAVAKELCTGTVTVARYARPFVISKFAMSADGAIAAFTKDGRGLSSEAERHFTHRLRDRVDAILVGSGVVLADDPRLTTRIPDEEAGDGGPHHPLRVVVDGRGASPVSAAIFSQELPGRTLLATTEAAAHDWLSVLRARRLPIAMVGDGPHVTLDALLRVLAKEYGVTTLLVEGGSAIHGAFFDAGLVDRVIYSVSPLILGGRGAVRPVGGIGRPKVIQAIRIKNPQLLTFPGAPGEIAVWGNLDRVA